MKRFMSLMLTLTLVALFFAVAGAPVEATDPACATNRTVFVHYHKWDGDYTGSTIWSWGYGTNGSGAGAVVSEEDSFGAVYQICVDDDAGDELGLILKYGDAWTGDDFTDRDGLDIYDDNGDPGQNGKKDNKAIVIKVDDAFTGFDESGIMHVWTFEGSSEVIYGDMPYTTTEATVAVIYYDVTGSYDDWVIHTWGTGTNGSAPDWGVGIPFVGSLGVDGGEVANFRVAFIQVDPTDADASIGFIVHKGDDKKYDGDISIPVADLVAGEFATYFYIAGEDSLRTTFTDFEETVNFFEISSASALDPNSIEVVFNKDVITKEDDVDIFDPATIVVTDKDDNVIAVDSISYNSTSDVNDTFTIITTNTLMGSASPYTVTYTPEVGVSYEKEFSVDSAAPVITIIGSTNVTLELGDSYSLPTFSATDMVGEETVEIYNARVKDGHGTVDTRNAGIYEIVIEAHDKFGNVAEETITVTVTDPCDDQAHLQGTSGISNLIGLLVGIPLVFGAVITLRKH